MLNDRRNQNPRKINYVKSADQFSVSDEGKVQCQEFLEMGNASQRKSIMKKIPSDPSNASEANKPKYLHLWMSKSPANAREVISSEGFILMLGEHCSPKYRVYVDHNGSRYVVTKWLAHFTPWIKISEYLAEIDEAEAATLNYHGDCKTPYGQYIFQYLKITSVLPNFNKVIAVCLLFGKEDINAGNWGIVEVNGKQFAATVDHGLALGGRFNLHRVLEHYGHRKEQFLTDEFVSACREVIAEYDAKKNLLQEIMSDCINSLKGSLYAPAIDELMRVLENNRNDLTNLSFQIEAEMAINNGDAAALSCALHNLPCNYFKIDEDPDVGQIIISMQSNSTTSMGDPNGSSLRALIQRRKFDDCEVAANDANMSDQDIMIKSELLAVYNEVAASKRPKESSASMHRLA